MEQHNFGGSFAGRFNPSVQDPEKEKLTKLKQEASIKKLQSQSLKKIRRAGFTLGKRLSQFQPPEQDFSQHEKVLRSMFGHGEKMWGNIREPVHINNDLNPRQRGDDETARMFGF